MAVLRKERKGIDLQAVLRQKGANCSGCVKSEHKSVKACLFAFIKGRWAILSLFSTDKGYEASHNQSFCNQEEQETFKSLQG